MPASSVPPASPLQSAADLPLARQTARELARLIRTRAVSPVEVLDAHLKVIEQINPKLTLVSLPAATAPAGLTRDQLPVGMQVVAPRFEEPLILNVARLIHRASGVGWPPAARTAAVPR